MKKVIALIYLTLTCLLAITQLDAQAKPVVDEIPDDLLITLKRQEGWGGRYSEMTITANGDFSYQSHGGMPGRSIPLILQIKGKSQKPPMYLKPKLSDHKLRSLIAEFERIRFFEFGKDFPVEDDREARSFSDADSEVISIRINGKTKEVFNYLGDSLKRTKLLRDLAERIRGAGIWNFENDEIPGNFQIWYRFTGDDKIIRDYKIEANGKIIKSSISVFPYEKKNGEFLPHVEKPRTVGKLSKQQLRQMIDEFEKVGFSAFRYSTLVKAHGCSNAPDPAFEKRIHINVQINHVGQMYASLYENCDPKPETDAAKFESVKAAIEKFLKAAGINM